MVSDISQAVILAAGKGTRLRPLTENKPKAMVEVAGRPLLEHVFDFLIENADIDEFIVVIGYEGDQIQAAFGNDYRGVPIQYAEQDEQRGLAHALRQAESLVDDDFLLMLGDLVFDPAVTLDQFLEAWAGADGALLTEQVPREEASRYGVVDTDSENRITKLVEKPDHPPTNQIISGVYGLPEEALEVCKAIEPSDRGEYEVTDVIQVLIQERNHDIRSVSMRADAWRIDVGYPEDRDKAEARISGE